LVLAVDPARYGHDQTAVAYVRGSVVEKILTWHNLSITETAARVIALAEAATIQPGMVHLHFEHLIGRPTLVVDEPGLGGGLIDILRERGWACIAFNGAAKPRLEHKFMNARSETLWHLRELLEHDRVALPRDATLEQELLAHEWTLTTTGAKIQVLGKNAVKSAIGRSPDRLDACAMGLAVARGQLGHAASTHVTYM
jgi:hypothetical protein